MQISAALQPADGSEPRAQTAAPPAAACLETPQRAASAAGLLPRRGELRGWHLAAPPLLRELATLVRNMSSWHLPRSRKFASACRGVSQDHLQICF